MLPVWLLGCGTSADVPSGLDQPIIVRDANSGRTGQFTRGSFPAGDSSVTPVSMVSVHNLAFSAGTVGKGVTGLAGTASPSISVALKGLGNGYWTVPTSLPDPTQNFDLTWGTSIDFARTIPAGSYSLLLAASDSHGNFSPPFEQLLEISSFLPVGHVVASLTWDSAADLDLRLTSPSGKQQSPKHPNTGTTYDAGPDAGELMPGSGLLDRDSNSGCVQDNYREEDVVWTDDPEPGLYEVNVDMFSACGAPVANFNFSLYVDGQQVLHKIGRLLDIDADGGGAGLFVTEFNCEGTGTCS
ncbi:MAG TPA: hypothetical protein VHW01_04990 [Polyangiaceae bacterium]|nr:hypothetical protein [Polyangiaceae bacterium]